MISSRKSAYSYVQHRFLIFQIAQPVPLHQPALLAVYRYVDWNSQTLHVFPQENSCPTHCSLTALSFRGKSCVFSDTSWFANLFALGILNIVFTFQYRYYQMSSRSERKYMSERSERWVTKKIAPYTIPHFRRIFGHMKKWACPCMYPVPSYRYYKLLSSICLVRVFLVGLPTQ